MSQRQSGLSYRCWDLSLGPLEEHIVLLTGEQFVHPSKINLKKKPNRLHKGGLSRMAWWVQEATAKPGDLLE